MILGPTILPNKITGVNLWIDCDDMSTINSGGTISDGTAVTAVRDKIGGVVFSGTGTFKKDTVVSGRNTILMNGTTNMLKATNVAALAGTVRTVYYVIKNLSSDATARYSLVIKNSSYSAASTSVANYNLAYWGSSSSFRIFGGSGGGSTTWAYFPGTNAVGMDCIEDRKGAIFSRTIFNTTKLYSTGAVMTDATSSNYMSLGANGDLTALHNCNICEVIHANVVLSDSDSAQIRRYLFNKWGV